MVLGNITKIIAAQAVKIYRGTDELVLTSDVKFRGTHSYNVTNSRAGPLYSFVWRVREIETTVALTEDLLTQIETDNRLNNRSALSFNNWRINGLSISGINADNTDDTYSAGLIDYDQMAPEQGVAQARIKLLIAATAT